MLTRLEGTKTLSSTSKRECGVTCKAEPKNRRNDTAPAGATGPAVPLGSARDP
ncbi:hypothetical protein [Hyalangium versicolor]|uniref:hypothetical protein n=1 Tax=Hyalangium versicolor TaxID=2861190 RepID=UPI001CCDA788|nr:hypothetical protein [Hyalangium versicolor]